MRIAVRTISSFWFAFVAFVPLCGLAGNSSYAQIVDARTSPLASTKPLLFEVASIRPSREGEWHNEDLLPDGFRLTNGSVRTLIGLFVDPAHILSDARLVKAPDWVRDDRVDVLAKVSAQETKEWQRETASGFGSPVFKYALQQLLVERCKLQAHTVSIDSDGYALILDRSGPKANLVPAEMLQGQDAGKPSQENSPGVTVPEQGLVKFRNQPLAELAAFMSNLSSYQIEDRTGLTGRYDFPIIDKLPVHPTASESVDLMLPGERWDLQPLGLKLVRSKVSTTALVIDHIERPSPN